MKYVLDYIAGTKGDFLCNYINSKNTNFDIANRSMPNETHLKYLWKIPLDEQILRNILRSDLKIIPGHFVHLLDSNLMESENRKIIKISYDDSVKNIVNVEGVFKNFRQLNTVFNRVRYHLKSFGEENFLKTYNTNSIKDFISKYKKVKYEIDFKLVNDGKELTDDNRSKKLIELLENAESTKPVYDAVYINLNYEDLYWRKNYKNLKKIDENFDENLFNSLLEKTWLPEKINLFGREWNPKDFGYKYPE